MHIEKNRPILFKNLIASGTRYSMKMYKSYLTDTTQPLCVRPKLLFYCSVDARTYSFKCINHTFLGPRPVVLCLEAERSHDSKTRLHIRRTYDALSPSWDKANKTNSIVGGNLVKSC